MAAASTQHGLPNLNPGMAWQCWSSSPAARHLSPDSHTNTVPVNPWTQVGCSNITALPGVLHCAALRYAALRCAVLCWQAACTSGRGGMADVGAIPIPGLHVHFEVRQPHGVALLLCHELRLVVLGVRLAGVLQFGL